MPRRREGTRFSSPNDDELGGLKARSARSERKRAIRPSERKRAEQLNIGSRGAVPRRREGTRLSSPNDDELGGLKARSARSERKRAEQLNTVG